MKMTSSRLRGAVLLAAACLGACAREGAPTPANSATSLVLAVSGAPVAESGNGVALTAQVRDAAGRPVPGVLVQFGADRGLVQVLSDVTDGFGTATARLGAIGASGQRTITATARTGTLSAQAQVQVGTAVSASAAPKCCKV